MKYEIKTRDGESRYITESKTVQVLYNTFIGRCFIKLLSLPFISKTVGWFLSTSVSKLKINSFISKNNIDISLYEEKEYKSFNDFFTRKIKKLNVDKDVNSFVSPCDSKLTVYDIDDESVFIIKGSYYSVSDLLDGNDISKAYMGGYALVFRLEATDYHRYIYIDNLNHEKPVFIKGVLNTVRPIVLKYFNIYKRNSREYTILHTENFGDVIQVEVGALLVGKINNFYEGGEHKKGEEKGMFEFGGSTIVLLVEKDKVVIDKDILDNSKQNIETEVKCGERIGKKNLRK